MNEQKLQAFRNECLKIGYFEGVAKVKLVGQRRKGSDALVQENGQNDDDEVS